VARGTVLESRLNVPYWFRHSQQPAPLTGAPAVPRQKIYSAQTGYVYRYFYRGHRPASRDGAAGAEYFFEAAADSKTFFQVPVFVGEDAVKSWEQGHLRPLSAAERYAVVKMALFQAFDERPTPSHMQEEVRVRATDIEAHLETLGID
jgi:hypothetical protein